MIRSFARPYVKAMLEVAATTEAAATLRDELTAFEHVRKSSSQLVDVFANPGFAMDSKLAVAATICEKLGLGELTRRVIQVLIHNHRINHLDAILEALVAGINEQLGRAVARVRSAHELTADERDALRAALEKRFGRTIELDLTTDDSLLGGFVAQLGSEVYDASVAGQLGKLRETLS